MATIIISVLLALLVITVPSWWATRENVQPRSLRVSLLVAVARLWLITRRHPNTVLWRLTRPVVAAALGQAIRIDGDARLTLPSRLVISAHRNDVAMLAPHMDDFADTIAAVLRRDLGLLVVPGRPVLQIEVDPTALPFRPHLAMSSPVSWPERPGFCSPVASAAARRSRARHNDGSDDTAVVPPAESSTVPLEGDRSRDERVVQADLTGQTVVVRPR